MGQGGYVFCEWDSVQKDDTRFQSVFAKLENDLINKCNTEWAPKTMGYLTPGPGQYGRTSILPRLFLGFGGAALPYWRQTITSTGHQTLIYGAQTGHTLREDIKVGWLGLAFPNKNQHITEIKFQIGDRKYGRINLEEMHSYNKPALIFEEPFIIDEETAFDLYGYVEGPIPTLAWGPTTPCIYQRIVMLGEACYKRIDLVLGNTGAVI